VSCMKLTAAQIAVIGAVLLVIADIVALIAAIKANIEEQEKIQETNCEIEAKIKYLQSQLR
jgi:hypothetical protein